MFQMFHNVPCLVPEVNPSIPQSWVNGSQFQPRMPAEVTVSTFWHMYILWDIGSKCLYHADISDLELVDRLSNGKVDLTFGR
jgi:hypothetical protein